MNNKFNALLTLDLQKFAEGQSEEQPEVSEVETIVEPVETTTQEKLLSQSEFEEALKKRLERERKKYADYEEIKAKASEYEAQLEAKRQSELTEVELAKEQAKKFEEQLNELNSQLAEERSKAQKDKIRYEFTKLATNANIIDIDAAIALSDLSTVDIDENGQVVGVDDVIKTLVESKPYLVGKKTTQAIGQATNNGTIGYVDKSAEQLLNEAMLKARKSGKHEDQMAYVSLKRQLQK